MPVSCAGAVRICGTTWLDSKSRILFGAFLPDVKHGSGVGDWIDGGGHSLKKERPDPAGETEKVSPTGPSQVEFKVGKVA